MNTRVACPLCKCRWFRTLGENPDFPKTKILRCFRCGLMWTFPRPSSKKLAELYRAQYREGTGQHKNPKYLEFMDARASAQKDFIVGTAKRECFPRHVLDVGCGAGSLLRAFADGADSLTGYEPDENMYHVARSRLPEAANLYNSVCISNGSLQPSYDLITLSHVLEHFRDPFVILQTLLRRLRPGGLLFVEIPNETTVSVSDLCKTQHRGLTHLWFFSVRSFREMAVRAGAKVVSLYTCGPSQDIFSVPYGDLRFLEKRGGKRLSTLRRKRIQLAKKAGEKEAWDSEVTLRGTLTAQHARGLWIRAVLQQS